MEFLPSISRSGGLNDANGNVLKNSTTQQEYWVFIQKRIDEYWSTYPPHTTVSGDKEIRNKLESENNLLILIRKLREGILASRRRDSMALQVYKTSFLLAIIFFSQKQIDATMSYMFDLYTTHKKSAKSSSNRIDSQRSSMAILALLYTLNRSYPLQLPYFQQLRDFSSLDFKQESEGYLWLASLRLSLNTQNWIKFEKLTSKSTLTELPEFASIGPGIMLHQEALFKLILTLQEKMREAAWNVLRKSYRLLTLDCAANSDWLRRTLTLRADTQETEDVPSLDYWINVKMKEGHIVPLEGYSNRYNFCK